MPITTKPTLGAKARGETGALARLLNARQDALVDRSIAIAKANGYAPFTTTIRAAWVEAILSVTEALLDYVAAAPAGPRGPVAEHDYRADPQFQRMRMIARQHRTLGITLQMYLGLFKHFRNIYVDALAELPADQRAVLTEPVRDFFDETELSITADWTDAADDQRLRELQERTRALTLEKDRYFAVFESLRNPAFLLDKARRLVSANQTAASLFLGDVDEGEIIYLRSMRRVKSSLSETLEHILHEAKSSDRAVWLNTLSGRRCFDIRMRQLHDALENTTLGHVLILNDVTSHRQATEAAQRAERQMSRFLATMSHEIRTPLHSVLGATELLHTADEDARGTYLKVIESAGQSLLQTLNNVLDYSKLESAPPAPRPVTIDLARSLDAFVRVAAVGSHQNGVRPAVHIARDVPQSIAIDWPMTRQVLSNLVSNALRFDDGRGVKIGVTGFGPGSSAKRARFEVRDHGPGLTSEDALGLTKALDTVRPRNTGGGGAGLGLAIAHHLVKAMGGRIGYRNEEPGALVWFELPFGDGADGAASPCEGAAADPYARSMRCLLVDDDPFGATVTARQLEHLGHAVDHAATVAEAMSRVTQETYDAFIVDYVLPDGDGPSLVKHLRAHAPGAARYIALTANVEPVKGSADLSRLFDTILAKPVDRVTLGEALTGSGPVQPSPAATPPAAGAAIDALSDRTVASMADAFDKQWVAFRQALRRQPESGDTAAMADTAHRLIGSAALLGLTELEPSLRDLERRCRAGMLDAASTDTLRDLDRDLGDLPSWRAVLERSAAP